MIGSVVLPDPRVLKGFGMMTQTEMEQLLENIDRRLARVEQKLPTLGTKEDLEDSRRHALMLNENTEQKIKLVGEGVSDLQRQFMSLIRRLEKKGVI